MYTEHTRRLRHDLLLEALVLGFRGEGALVHLLAETKLLVGITLPPKRISAITDSVLSVSK